MAASTSVLAPSNGSDAVGRLWMSAISNALSAAGWTTTSDTGQINLTTVVMTGATNTSVGYQIWQTNDGLTTWYLKIEYGSGNANASTPGIWLTIGTGTNGSGTLTGQTSTRRQIAASSNSASTYNCHFGGGTGWFTCMMYTQVSSATQYHFWFSIERTKDNTGADTSTGMSIVAGSAYATAFHQTVPASGTIWAADTTFIPMAFSRNASLIAGANIGTVPMLPQGQYHYPAALGVVGFYATDISNSSTFTLSRYGTNRTYVACRLANTNTIGPFGTAAGNAIYPALRYE